MRAFRILALAALAATLSTAAAAEGDPAEGEKVFKKCSACHAVGPDAKNKVGPVLNGTVGSPVASVEDYKYSKAFLEKKEEGLVWTEEALSQYLQGPRAFIPGTKMSFVGLKSEEDIADVIAYLKQFE